MTSLMNKSTLLLLTFLMIFIILGGCGVYHIAQSAAPLAPTPSKLSPQSDTEAEIRQAIEKALEVEKPAALALLLYETQIEQIQTSFDEKWATAWLIPVDPSTGHVVPTEPGLALARVTDQGWQAFLPSDPMWTLVMKNIPAELISDAEKNRWIQMAEYMIAAISAPIGGYYLPYAGGETMALTQSVGHDRYTPSGSAHFAFDFAKPGYPSGMFEVHAARGGIVKQAVWTNPNGDHAHANYIVLEDTSTNPTTYQLYMHFAKDSIPTALRVIGAPVRRGQLIGIADNTGVSSGNHLHFMVHTNKVSYWGTSIDITFNDVSINGGRPRIASDKPYCKSTDVCDSIQTTYLSQNFMVPDHFPPTGGITSPPHGSLISSGVLPLQGWAEDENSGIARVQFQAYFNGSWKLLGSPFTTNSFEYEWDLCASGVPDGPVSLALTIMDKAQNQASGLPGLIHFTKNYDCPSTPSSCNPTANQIALFSGTDFQGRCVLLGAGSYNSASQLGALGDDDAESILVGANVQATLFSKNNLLGRGETFFFQDSSLADNHIGSNSVSSVRVQARSALPSVPSLVWPENGASLPDDASFSLSWENTGGASAYQLELSLNGSQVLLSPFISDTFWNLNSLTSGQYTWRVKANNPNGQSSWSSWRSLIITQTASGVVSDAMNVPYQDTMEAASSQWIAVNWTLSGDANHTPGGSFGWKYTPGGGTGYDNGLPNFGSLTSPVINLPAETTQYLRFYYQQETEENPHHWDQRWVQISTDGGPFMDLLRLDDDPAGYWLRSPAISLAQFAGHSIQVRFYFATLDSDFNQFAGWFIDDVSITADLPPVCSDNDNNPAQANRINYGESHEGVICPGGDVDYYQFQAIAGDRIGVRTQAQTSGSPLDTVLELLDTDGKSILASNDDIVQFERRDSHITYHFKRTGTYYLKVRAWDHPEAGNTNHAYSLHLSEDKQDPIASFITPTDGSTLNKKKIMLTVAARDDGSGVALVRFYWHSNDWLNSGWVYLGEDWEPDDGWNLEFDTSTISDLNGIAVYAVVFDWAGNWVGTGAWNLHQPMLYLPIIKNPR